MLLLQGSPVHAFTLARLDLRATTLSTTTYVRILMIDSSGRRTGYLNGEEFQEIPDSGRDFDSIGDDVTGTPGIESDILGVSLSTSTLGSQNLTIVLTGLATSTYNLDIDGSDALGKSAPIQPQDVFDGFLTAGVTQQFQITYDPALEDPRPSLRWSVLICCLRNFKPLFN